MNYGVTFDMFAKVDVKGTNACDLYEFLTSMDAPPRALARSAGTSRSSSSIGVETSSPALDPAPSPTRRGRGNHRTGTREDLRFWCLELTTAAKAADLEHRRPRRRVPAISTTFLCVALNNNKGSLTFTPKSERT